MKNKIATNAEVKALLGISGSGQDAQIEMWNVISTEALCKIFGIDDLVYHSIIDERVKVYDPKEIYLVAFPVDVSTLSLEDINSVAISGLTYDIDPHRVRTVRIYDTSSRPTNLGYNEVLASYSAGYTVQDVLKVLDITALDGKTITVKIAGVITSWEFKSAAPDGNQILIGATVDACATNIAAALGGVAVTDTVTLPQGSSVELGTATTTQFTITSATIDETLKMAVALMVGGGVKAKDKVGGVSSYRIGSKQVTFSSNSDKQQFVSIMNNWLPYFKQVKIIT